MFSSCLWKDVRDRRDEDVGAPDAPLDQTSQGLPALQPRPAVYHDHTELPVLLKGLAEDVVDERRAEKETKNVGKVFASSPCRLLT